LEIPVSIYFISWNIPDQEVSWNPGIVKAKAVFYLKGYRYIRVALLFFREWTPGVLDADVHVRFDVHCVGVALDVEYKIEIHVANTGIH
jgi:hypothetical protein